MTNSYPLLSSQNNCNICALCVRCGGTHAVWTFFLNVIKIQIKFICIKHSCRSIWIRFSPPQNPRFFFFYHQILLLNNVKRLETALKWRKVIKIKMLCPIPADFNLFFYYVKKCWCDFCTMTTHQMPLHFGCSVTSVVII